MRGAVANHHRMGEYSSWTRTRTQVCSASESIVVFSMPLRCPIGGRLSMTQCVVLRSVTLSCAIHIFCARVPPMMKPESKAVKKAENEVNSARLLRKGPR